MKGLRDALGGEKLSEVHHEGFKESKHHKIKS